MADDPQPPEHWRTDSGRASPAKFILMLTYC